MSAELVIFAIVALLAAIVFPVLNHFFPTEYDE